MATTRSVRAIYVAYAVDWDVVLRPWYGRVVFYAILGAAIWTALCVISHSTARRAAVETVLQQAHRMEAIGQLASGVAHDFNNLLATVIGNLDRIALHRQATPEVRRVADKALRAAERGTSLTARLLAFARRQPLHPTAVQVNCVLDAILPLLKDAVGETIDVPCELNPGLSAIRIDPGQFEAALLNLALNARDAMPRGGTLRITARNAIVAAGEAKRREIPAGDYVVIEIADTASGMPADIARRAFEPFFTTKGLGKGGGLGLAMVHGFARQSGGARNPFLGWTVVHPFVRHRFQSVLQRYHCRSAQILSAQRQSKPSAWRAMGPTTENLSQCHGAWRRVAAR